jgi:methyl halide transferase
MQQDLSAEYWNQRYLNRSTQWDLGEVSPPLKNYIDQLDNKNISILIPGAGNSYEAIYLMQQGFTNITVIDIAHSVIEQLTQQYPHQSAIQFIQADFFTWQGQYDLILEQTFFCAIDPQLRANYVQQMANLLTPHGLLVGLLFNRPFENGPPFGGNQATYEHLFSKHLQIHKMETCYNSIAPRANTELFFMATKALLK